MCRMTTPMHISCDTYLLNSNTGHSCGVNVVLLGIKFLQTICVSVHLHLICPHQLWNIEETEMERESER